MARPIPGPWKVREIGAFALQIINEDSFYICEIDREHAFEVDNANAALIAAAPDIYEALKKILHHQCYGTATSYALALEDGKKAIVKAENKEIKR